MPVVLDDAGIGEAGSGIEPRKHSCIDSMESDEEILPHSNKERYPHSKRPQMLNANQYQA